MAGVLGRVRATLARPSPDGCGTNKGDPLKSSTYALLDRALGDR
jgi:hypothetical protein